MAFVEWMSRTWGNMSGWDWAIMAIAVVLIRLVSLSTRHFMRGVADFLSANRAAGRYLLTIAGQMGGMGAISFIAVFQVYFSAGFPPLWWGFMAIPATLIISLTGWIFYRYRETRALTMAQFYEMRYNKPFRIFSGVLNWACGVINFGIFPAVTAHFFIYFCGLPETYQIPGIPLNISTFATVMALDLGLALLFVTQGGQISVMVTECVQGMFSAVAFIIIGWTVLLKLNWPEIVQALNTAPKEASMLHPYHTSQVSDFNIWFYLISLVMSFYGYMSWLGTQGFYCSAKSPHEQKMGNIIGNWRLIPQGLISVLLPIAAYSVMHLGSYSGEAARVTATLATVENEAVRNQMMTPVAMAYFLPMGVKGLLATCMLFYSFTCHDTYMHSWGSIFVQDVYMPLRKKSITPQQHITLLRWSIAFVAFFGFVFSLVYPQSDKILMFFAITGTISGAGAGAVIIGGLYWRRGTTVGAYASLIVGAIFGVAGVVVYPIYKHMYGRDFPVNGQWFSFIVMIIAILVYVIVSMKTSSGGREFNLERLLHRGRYTDESAKSMARVKPSRVEQIFGITEEFSLSDKILAVALVFWNAFWVLSFLGATAWHFLVNPLPTSWFAGFWRFYVWQFAITSIPVVIWFQIGGILDIKDLFRTLATAERDHTDDGRVVHRTEEEWVPACDQPKPETPLAPIPEDGIATETDGGSSDAETR